MTDRLTTLERLGERVWQWRDEWSFRTGDDIPRWPRERSWLPRIDADSVAERIETAARLRAELAAIDLTDATDAETIAARLVGSAIERLWWDCAVVRSWERDANFLVGQVLGPYFDLLLEPAPFDAERQRGLVVALEAVPGQVGIAIANLGRAGSAELAGVAIGVLEDIETRLPSSVAALAAFLDPDAHAALTTAGAAAATSLVRLREWLEAGRAAMPPARAVGRDAFRWYLRNVALIADEPEELVRAAEQEYRRAVVWESLARGVAGADPAPFGSIDEQVARHADDEQAMRDFAEERDLLSQDGFGHYLIAPMPPYLSVLPDLGVTDDLTDRHRPGTDGVSYSPDPRDGLPYFYAANAIDPRLGNIHEGAHYQQLVRAWAQPDPLRRHYYDSTANEGIAFYNEELMLQAGLFADAPSSRSRVHNFMRLRALRVIVDIGLATGELDLQAGIRAFVERVPVDEETAREETAMYLAAPGLAMSYQVGKLQVMRLAADAIVARGGDFGFREFHDWLWRNGNLPMSLLRLELLGDRGELDAIDRDDVARPEALEP